MFKNVLISRYVNGTHTRTKAGINVMKQVTDAAQLGNTVSARTYYEGTDEMMDAEIIWDQGIEDDPFL